MILLPCPLNMKLQMNCPKTLIFRHFLQTFPPHYFNVFDTVWIELFPLLWFAQIQEYQTSIHFAFLIIDQRKLTDFLTDFTHRIWFYRGKNGQYQQFWGSAFQWRYQPLQIMAQQHRINNISVLGVISSTLMLIKSQTVLYTICYLMLLIETLAAKASPC